MPAARPLLRTFLCALGCLTVGGAWGQSPKGAERLVRPRLPAVDQGAGRSNEATTSADPGANSDARSAAPIQIQIGPYFGWERCLTISNGKVEAVVVPAVGRVMVFRRAGASSVFWQDPALRGKAPDPEAKEWANFGGDKTWPAPQAEWGRMAGRDWPPPAAFDSMPAEAFFRRDAIVLRSPVDRHYGIRWERELRLDREAPVMTVVTTYEKVEGPPVRTGIWVITQLEDPVGVFARIPRETRYAEGFNRQSGENLPAGLAVAGGVLSLRRGPDRWAKIGLDADRLVWVGETAVLRIDSPRVEGGEYPDQGSSAEVYTNPDPKAYVELEMLGPLHTLSPGERIQQTNTYSLFPRSHPDPAVDARRVLSR